MIKKYWNFLSKYLFEKKKWFAWILILSAIQCILNIVIPLYYKIIIDSALPNEDKKLFVIMIICMSLSFVFIAAIGIQRDFYLSKLSEVMAEKIRVQLNNKISHMFYSEFDEHSLSDIVARYSKEVEIIKENAGKYFIKIFSNIFTVIFASIMIIMLDWRILFVTFIVIYTYIKINSYFGKRLKEYSEKVMKSNNDAINILTENYNNVLVIKMLQIYEFAHKRFIEKYNRLYNAQILFDLNCSANINIGILVIQLLGCVIWGIGGFSIFEGQSSIGNIMAIINYQSMLLSPINFLCQFNSSFQSAQTAINRILEILNLPEEHGNELSDLNELHEISMENLSFAYRMRKEVLKNININFKKGEITALMGPSGSGKSTILKLLMGLYECSDGVIKFDNQVVSTSNIIAMRKNISYVAPESTFFEGTIKENMFLEDSQNTALIEDLSSKFGINDEIHNLQDGWNTVLSSGGTNLSTGQKRRLDFVRIFARDKNVIILDEPTAALDKERRKKFYEYLQSIKKDKIIIVVTHNIDEKEYFDKTISLSSK